MSGSWTNRNLGCLSIHLTRNAVTTEVTTRQGAILKRVLTEEAPHVMHERSGRLLLGSVPIRASELGPYSSASVPLTSR